jgi:DNA polymerase-3 subunit delta'
MRQRLRTTRGRAGSRLVVVDAIDDCNASAANALLKILEEPPADTFFLLVSHRPGALLPTIRSRCADLPLRPLSDGEVRAVLEANMPGQGEDKLAAAVALAGGRPRRAFEALTVAGDGTLAALRQWLAAPLDFPPGAHLALADALAGDSAEAGFGRDMLLDWMAQEAREAALAGPDARVRLASASELWEKAQALLAETDALNLDLRETLVEILDAIRRHLSDSTAVFS